MAGRKAWGLDLSLGGNFSRGNVDTDALSTSFSGFKAFSGASVYLAGAALYGTASGRRVLNQASLTLRADHPLPWEAWKVFAFAANSFNEFLRLNHRATTGAGPWYDLLLGPTSHGLSLAIVQEHEVFKYGREEDHGRLSLRSLSRVPLGPASELTADFYWTPSLRDGGDRRLYGEIALQAKVWRDSLGLRLAWIAEHDSRPRPGVRKDDATVLTSLTARFGK